MNRILPTLVVASFLAIFTPWAASAEIVSDGAGEAWPRLSVTHSWFANSHADARFMPQGIEGVFVSPDGTTFTNIRWEEGGGNVVVIDANGDVHPRPHMPGYHGWGHGGGRAVAANSKYVYFSQQYNNEGGSLRDPNNWPPAGKVWYGISRRSRESIGGGPPFVDGKGGKDCPAGCFLPVHEVDDSTKEDAAHLRSICANETEVFVACPLDKRIRVFDAEEMTLKRSWEVEDAWQIALDGEGALWVAIGEDATEVRRYDARGKRLSQSITLPPGSRLGSFCIDSTGRMLIGDVGEDEWVLIYSNITTVPKPAGTFGTKRGIFSGTPGALGPLKFSQVRGIGVDAEGSIYIANTQYRTIGPGVWLEKYSSEGELRWRRHCVVFTDSNAVDPESDGRVIYGMTERYDVDLEKPPGQEATLAAFTANFYKYPHDPRFVQYDNSGVYVRSLDNRKFIITTGMGSGQSPLCIYRLAPETDGEVMIPCVVWTKSTKYPHAPEGNWLWRDTNGDGHFDAGEYTKTDVHDAYGGNSAFVDTRGDIWMTCWGPLRKITYQGLDPHGVPIYAPESTTIDAPEPLTTIRRVRYDVANDVMYLAGTSGDKTHHWKSMGIHLCRYDKWSKGNRAAAWHVVCTHKPEDNCEPISFDVAGDYVFVAIAERGKVGERDISRGHISVYHNKTGVVVGFIEPPSDWGVGWMDAVECLSVHRRQNGEYLIVQEEDGRSKNLLHRWTPKAPAAAAR
jgi:hypothetical protein